MAFAIKQDFSLSENTTRITNIIYDIGDNGSTEYKYDYSYDDLGNITIVNPFGRYGSKMGLYYPITRTDHIQIHSEYGNGRGFGGYNQYYPFDNWWTVIRKIYGAE